MLLISNLEHLHLLPINTSLQRDSRSVLVCLPLWSTRQAGHTLGGRLCVLTISGDKLKQHWQVWFIFSTAFYKYLFFFLIHNYSNRNYCLSLAHTRHQLAAPPGCPGTLEQNHWDQARIPAAKSQQMHLLFWSRHHNISRLRRFEMFSLSHRHTPRCWSKYKRAFSEGVSMRRRRSKKKNWSICLNFSDSPTASLKFRRKLQHWCILQTIIKNTQ